MFITLIVCACVAALVAGVILLAFKLFRRKPPKWLVPAAMGLSVLAYVTFARYTWHLTMMQRLPYTVTVVEEGHGSSPFEPWTYLWPRVTHFAVVDQARVRYHPAVSGVLLVDVVFLAENEPTRVVPQVVDCLNGRRALVTDSTTLTPEVIAGDDLPWQEGRTPPALFEAVCSPDATRD